MRSRDVELTKNTLFYSQLSYERSLFYSQLSYQLERNIVNYLSQLESKEKRTHERSSLKVTI